MLRIPGYEDDPLADGAYLLDEQLFWPVHLLQCTSGHEDRSVRRSAFGVDQADLWPFYERVSDERQWPVLSIPLPAGHLLHVVYRNFVEDYGVDDLLHHPGWEAIVPLATVEGHYRGPGLCWPELLAASRAPAGAGEITSPDARMLLLLPIMSDADLPADAEDVLAAALAARGTTRNARALARLLLEEQEPWGPQRWRVEQSVRYQRIHLHLPPPGQNAPRGLGPGHCVLSGGDR